MLHTIQERIRFRKSQSCRGVPLSPAHPESTAMPGEIVTTIGTETGVSRIACDVSNIPSGQTAGSLRAGETVRTGNPTSQRGLVWSLHSRVHHKSRPEFIHQRLTRTGHRLLGGRGIGDRMNKMYRMPTRGSGSNKHPVHPVDPVQKQALHHVWSS